MTTLNSRLTEILELAGKCAQGPYRVDRVDFEHGSIAYEVCKPNEGLHVAFYEMNCLDQKISAKAQAEMYAQSRTLIPQLVEALKLAISQRDEWLHVTGDMIRILNELDLSEVQEYNKNFIASELDSKLEAILRRV